MASYVISTSKAFDKAYAKLQNKDKNLTDIVINKLANNEPLGAKYKDHALKGKMADFRDCHIKPDLVLIYTKDKDLLILTAVRIGTHSELFK
ncbi:MAG: type II toxin-antitoxin system YafQ family toxin [Campylobacteraceae bacterium]|jgi:mRNA interferase YafQ|nr:type II toxin-antitoxin system YafQ family toxin [Campylobacteraceae bacterium]